MSEVREKINEQVEKKSNLIDLDNLTLGDIERLKKALGVETKEADEQKYKRRYDEIGTRPGWMPVIQINMGSRKYFCETEAEELIFNENFADQKTEKFKIELPITTARKYLDDPVNKAAFEKKGKE